MIISKADLVSCNLLNILKVILRRIQDSLSLCALNSIGQFCHHLAVTCCQLSSLIEKPRFAVRFTQIHMWY